MSADNAKQLTIEERFALHEVADENRFQAHQHLADAHFASVDSRLNRIEKAIYYAVVFGSGVAATLHFMK